MMLSEYQILPLALSVASAGESVLAWLFPEARMCDNDGEGDGGHDHSSLFDRGQM